MKDVVVWSGGFDSTYMIIYLIENNKLSSNTIDLVSINSNLVGESKNEREEKARRNILEYLKKKYSYIKFNLTTINTNVNLADRTSTKNHVGLAQPIIWTSQLIPVVSDNSKIYFGYIVGDDALSYKNTYQDFINKACEFQGYKNISIEFPLSTSYRKETIIKSLINNHYELLDLCTSCENISSDDKCGLCVPCIHLKNALINIILECNTGSKKANYLLRKWFSIEIDIRQFTNDMRVDNTELTTTIEEVPDLKHYCTGCMYLLQKPTSEYDGFGNKVFSNKCEFGYEIMSETELCTRPCECKMKSECGKL